MAIRVDLVNKTIGAQIKFLRISRRYTQDEFSKSIGISRATLANIECGKHDISIVTIYKCAHVLKVEVAKFLPAEEDVYSSNSISSKMAAAFTDDSDVKRVLTKFAVNLCNYDR